MFFKLKNVFVDIVFIFVRLNLIRLSEKYWTVLHLKRAVSTSCDLVKSVNKIAFLVHDDISFDHIQNVIKHLPNDSFDIILTHYKGIFCFSHVLDIILKRNYTKIPLDRIKKIVKRDYSFCCVRTIHDVVKKREKYRWLICGHNGLNHTARYMVGNKVTYGAQLISNHLGYFQFAIDPEQASNVRNCQNFDKIFCVGSWQEEQFKSMPINAKVFNYGSPRFDDKMRTRDNLDVKSLLSNYNRFDYSKKTIVWLPTHTKATTVIDFLPNMQNLTKEYNVLLKAHTDCFSEIKDLEAIIRGNAPDIILVKDKDSSDLMVIADFVCCDYGGSVFTAIGMDKNIILLNSKHDSFARKHFCTDCKNGKIRLRDSIINFYNNEQERLLSMLKNESVWKQQRPVRQFLRKQYFSVYQESSGSLIANNLIQGLKI